MIIEQAVEDTTPVRKWNLYNTGLPFPQPEHRHEQELVSEALARV